MTDKIFTTLILLTGCALVAQAALLGGRECTYGPDYWCGSLRNAKQCSAVRHCIQTVWEKQQLPEDNDEICDICKDMVQQARDQLQSNQTQEELKAVFEGACHLIPLKEISAECSELADEFIPELIETLASQMNPQIVCATAGLCNSVRIDMMLRDRGMSHNGRVAKDKAAVVTTSSSVSLPDPGDCDDCHKYIEDTIKLVREHSKQELLDHLLAICGELGSMSDGCSALMAVNINSIYDYLANKLNADDACTLFGMCNTKLFGPVSRPPSANTGDEVCDFCVVIAQHWRDELTSNTTEEQFQEILEGICQQTGSFKDECKSLVDNYYQAAYNYLMDEFQPKKLCEVVGICKSNTNNAIWTTLHTGPLAGNAIIEEEGGNSFDRASLTFVGQDEANSYRQQHDHSSDVAAVLPRAQLTPSIKITVAGEKGVLAGGDQACTMCEFTLHFIQIQLQDKRTKEDIENAVKSVCSYLPKDVEENCDDYVDAYGDQVIALLQQEIDPSVLCPMLGLCPSNSSAAPSAAVHSNTDVTCVACEFVMVKVKELLGDKRNEDAIRVALDNVCGLLPRSLSDECETFIDENAIEVMQLLAGGVDPEQICHLLGLCHDNKDELLPLDASSQLPVSRLFAPNIHRPQPGAYSLEHGGQSKVCVVCEFAITMMERVILDNTSYVQDQMEKAVEEVCILLPTTLQEDCLGFVEQYGQALIQLLINDLPPKMVCRELHLCKPPKIDALPHALIVTRSVGSATSVPEERQCLICKAVVTTYIGSTQDFGGDAAAVTAAVGRVCSALTTDEEQFCMSVDVSGAVIDNSSSNTAVCASLHYCPANRPLVGSEKCTWGPSYWCQSLLHAQSCGATPHCQDRVWMGAAPSSE